MKPDATSLMDRLEDHYQFECEGGPLKNCVEWRALKTCIEIAIGALKKTDQEFQTAGKPKGYIGTLFVRTALAELAGEVL